MADEDRESRVSRAAFVLTILSLIAIVLLLVFGTESIAAGRAGYGLWLLLFASLTALNYFLFLLKRNHLRYRNGAVFLMGLLFLSFIYTGGVANTGPLWFYVLPLVTFYICGLRTGTLIVLVMLGLSSFLLFIPLEPLEGAAYPGVFKGRFLSSMALVSLMAYALEYARQKARTRLVEQMHLLEEKQKEINQKNKRMENDLLMAQQLQQSLLPKHIPPFPSDGAVSAGTVRFGHLYLPSETVGGDFFHIMKRFSDLPLPMLLDRVVEEAGQFSETGNFLDDVCIVGIEIS